MSDGRIGRLESSSFFLSAQFPPSLAGRLSHLHFLLHWLLSCVSSLSCCIHPSIRTQRIREKRQISRVTGLVGTSESRLKVLDTYFFWNLEYYLPGKQGHSQEDNDLNFPGEVNWLALKNLDLMDKQLAFNQRLKSISLSLTFLTFLVFSLSLQTSHMAFYLMVNSHALTCMHRA